MSDVDDVPGQIGTVKIDVPESVENEIKVIDNKTQLPVESHPIKLNVATTSVTKKRVAELIEICKDLPEIIDDDTLSINKTARNTVKSERTGAKKYATNLNQQIQKLKQKVTGELGDLELELHKIEDPISEKIQDYENKEAIKKAERKKAREEKNRKIDEAIDEIKNMAVKLIKATSSELDKEIEKLDDMEFTEEDFGDRINEAVTQRELIIDVLEEMSGDAKEFEKKQAELKKREDEIEANKKIADKLKADEKEKDKLEKAEKKRVDDIKTKIKDLEQYIVKAVMAEDLNHLQDVWEAVVRIKISDIEYQELFNEATEKHEEVTEKIHQILQLKMSIRKKNATCKMFTKTTTHNI